MISDDRAIIFAFLVFGCQFWPVDNKLVSDGSHQFAAEGEVFNPAPAFEEDEFDSGQFHYSYTVEKVAQRYAGARTIRNQMSGGR